VCRSGGRDHMVTEKIGRYDVVEELGRGAMGVVYKVRDPNIGRFVALKTMRLDVQGLEHDEVLRRFRHEARAAGRMNHPNVVIVFDAQESDGLFYIAMEYIQGETLYSILSRQKTLAADKIIDYSRQICAGLDYAHSMGVIHRDVKPANIMITPQGTAKIMDFGVAKMGASLTQDGTVVGTPDCMSPEQVKGRPLDGRSDLFSYGVVLYQMFTGTKPFVGEDVTSVIYKIISAHPVPPRDLDPSIHPGLSAIVLKTLAKDPNDRYQTGAELARDLENYTSVNSIALTAAAQRSSTPAYIPPVFNAPSREPDLLEELRPKRTSPWIKWGITLVAWSIVIAAFMAPTPLHDKTLSVLEQLRVMAEAKFGRGRLAPLFNKLKPLIANSKPTDSAPTQGSLPDTNAPATPSEAAAQTQPDSANQEPASAPSQPSTSPVNTPTAAEVPADNTSPAKAIETATVQFESTPAGASVQIDGRSDPAWITPVSIPELSPGAHQLVFAKAGYLAEAREVDVSAGKSNYSVSLTAAGATLNISSEPKGAHIMLDGRETGRITPAEIRVESGEHTIGLTIEKYRPASTLITLRDGQVFNYAPVLQAVAAPTLSEPHKQNISPPKPPTVTPAKMGGLDVRSTPPGAYIVINGRNTGKITPQHLSYPPGRYFLTLRLDDYKPVTQIIVIEEGKPLILNQTLERN
jgi:serine/threonine protein kinase